MRHMPDTARTMVFALAALAGAAGSVAQAAEPQVGVAGALDQKAAEKAFPAPIWWNEARELPQAWPFDAHLLDAGWTKTRGAQVCATRAMRALHVEDEEMQRIVREEGLQVLHPEYGTKPRVYYKNLDRYFKAFVGGSLAGEIGGVDECVAGARVVLKHGAQTVAETTSDPYGDFKFAGLEEGSGAYRIEIADERFAPKSVGVELGLCTYLGTIALAPRSTVAA